MKKNKKNRQAIEKTAPAAETQGVIPTTRSELQENSKPVLSAMPHGPPDYKPTEPMIHNIQPSKHLETHPLDFSLPKETQPVMFKENRFPVRPNPLILQDQSIPNITPAHNLATIGDNRHEIMNSPSNYQHNDQPINMGENRSAQLEGGSFSSFWNNPATQIAAMAVVPGYAPLKVLDMAKDKGGGLGQFAVGLGLKKLTGTSNPSMEDMFPSEKTLDRFQNKLQNKIQNRYVIPDGGKLKSFPKPPAIQKHEAVPIHHIQPEPRGGKFDWGRLTNDLIGIGANASRFAIQNPDLMSLALA